MQGVCRVYVLCSVKGRLGSISLNDQDLQDIVATKLADLCD